MEWCEKFYVKHGFERVMHRLYGITVALVLLCLILVGTEVGDTSFSSGRMAAREGHAAEAADGTERVDILAENMAEEIGGPGVKTAGISSAKVLYPVLSGAVSEGVSNCGTDFMEAYSEAVSSNTGMSEKMEDEGSSLSAPAVPDKMPESISDGKENIVADLPEVLPDTPAKPEEIPSDPGTSADTDTEFAEVEGFLVDENGTICSIADPGKAVKNGYMRLPSEGCSSVAADAFANVPSGIIEVYIPANITYIEEGAFAGFGQTEWFSTDPSGAYTSRDGVLFSEGGTCLLAFPAGRIGIYKVPQGVLRFATGAFEGASISKLDIRNCSVEDMGNMPETIQIL